MSNRLFRPLTYFQQCRVNQILSTFKDNLDEAFKPKLVEGKWHRPAASNLDKAYIKKHFRLLGEPCPIPEHVQRRNPYDKAPKGHKADHEKPMRLARIEEAMKAMPEKIAQYRIDQKAAKKPKGWFALLSKFKVDDSKKKKKKQ
eukprot:GILI01018002.1.p1 GENE.GILI01018002.1~~GILI01018002.1.p1  ORF type:complete len:144 (-),score=37.40 GILI01018002.1:55-486(-)